MKRHYFYGRALRDLDAAKRGLPNALRHALRALYPDLHGEPFIDVMNCAALDLLEQIGSRSVPEEALADRTFVEAHVRACYKRLRHEDLVRKRALDIERVPAKLLSREPEEPELRGEIARARARAREAEAARALESAAVREMLRQAPSKSRFAEVIDAVYFEGRSPRSLAEEDAARRGVSLSQAQNAVYAILHKARRWLEKRLVQPNRCRLCPRERSEGAEVCPAHVEVLRRRSRAQRAQRRAQQQLCPECTARRSCAVHRRKRGRPPGPPNPKMAEARLLRQQGMYIKDIAKRLGVHPRSVWTWVQ